MDVKRQKKLTKWRKQTGYAAVLVSGIAFAGALLTSMDFTAKRIDRSNVMIGVVQSGKLEITVSANGTLKPRNVEWLTSQVDGRVAEVLVQPGDVVTAGQVLLRLSNPGLIASADEALAAWEGAAANTISTKVSLERDVLNQESVVMRAQFAMEKTALEVVALRELGSASAAITLRKAELELKQLKHEHEIERKKIAKMVENAQAMIAVNEASVAQLENALTRARQQVAYLEIVAGISGVVQEMPYKIGQQVKPGEQLGKIAQPDKLYSELEVPALRAGEIQVGQRVKINARSGFINGRVERVDPTVTSGNVIVDVALDSESDIALRPGLPIEGVIYVAELAHALHVDKPAYARAHDQISVYRLDEQGYAVRTSVRVGKVSINQIEILEGLQAGDRIILSDSSSWQDHSKILLD
jgi:HlyD family secretion protein